MVVYMWVYICVYFCLCVFVCVCVCMCVGGVWERAAKSKMIIVIPSKDHFDFVLNIRSKYHEKKIILADRSAKHTAQNIGHTHTHKHTQTKKHTHTISFYI